MTLLLNYSHVILTVIALAALFYFRKNIKVIPYIGISYAVLLFTLMAIGPSYLPKTATPNYDAPLFEATQDATIENRLREPELTPEEREAKAKELFDWKERVRKEEQTKNKPEPEETKSP